MRKGVTGIQNVWFLRAAEELGIGCQWNVLWGFPGEDPQEYDKMAALFPKLCHLQAPVGSGKIHLLRHSPNHTSATELGFSGVRPFPSYELAFGPHDHLSDQAYLFEYTYADGRDPQTYTREVERQATRWMKVKRHPLGPLCQVFTLFGQRMLVDTRRRRSVGRGVPRFCALDDDEWALLEALESPVPRARLEREWQRAAPLEPLLRRFIADAWAVEGDGRVVRLVVIHENPTLLAHARRVAVAKAHKLRSAIRRYL